MTIDNAIRVLAGSMILLSLYLTWYVNPLFVWLTVFVALNLIQSAFTGLCPAVFFLRKLGFKDSCQPCSSNKTERPAVQPGVSHSQYCSSQKILRLMWQ